MCHVLIIEDEPLVAMDLEDLLAQEGATSFSFAATQDEAVALALDQPPGFITSDVQLLSGTGPDAVAIIHDRLGPVPVIFITGTPEACISCDAARVLTKPYDRSAVLQAYRASVTAG